MSAARMWLRLVLFALGQLWLLWLIMAALVLHGCGPAFVPAYEGEPECGSPRAIHAQERALCNGSVMVACSCDDRISLECRNGLWVFEHDGCAGGLGVSVQSDGGAP